jgi:hypothetical protein
VKPLRCAVHAARKPGVAIELRIPCCAQAQGVSPCTPVRHMCRTPGHPSNNPGFRFNARRAGRVQARTARPEEERNKEGLE